MKVLIFEDESVMRQKLVEAFAAVGYSVQDMDRALKALADAFAPVSGKLTAADFSGLEGRLLAIDEFYDWEGNHPDGWYRKFYSDTAFYNPNVNLNARYRIQSAFKSRQISRSSDRRVNNKNYARFLASHSSVV